MVFATHLVAGFRRVAAKPRAALDLAVVLANQRGQTADYGKLTEVRAEAAPECPPRRQAVDTEVVVERVQDERQHISRAGSVVQGLR